MKWKHPVSVHPTISKTPRYLSRNIGRAASNVLIKCGGNEPEIKAIDNF